MQHENFKPDYMNKKNRIQEELLQKLKEIVPEAIEDGPLNSAKLKELLGDDLNDNPDKFGHYGMSLPCLYVSR